MPLLGGLTIPINGLLKVFRHSIARLVFVAQVILLAWRRGSTLQSHFQFFKHLRLFRRFGRFPRLLHPQQLPHILAQVPKTPFGLREGIYPVQVLEVVFLGTLEGLVGDAEGQDGFLVFRGQFDFAVHLLGAVEVAREDNDHHAALVQRLDNVLGPHHAFGNVAVGNETADAVLFQVGTHAFGHLLVEAGVGDENVVFHGFVGDLFAILAKVVKTSDKPGAGTGKNGLSVPPVPVTGQESARNRSEVCL